MTLVRKRLKATDRKRQILATAVTVFAESNYKSARVSDIAGRIGISEAAIYNHFPSKKAIFVAILDHIQSRVLAFWQSEAGREPDPVKALREMGTAYVDRLNEHPDELKVQFQAISEVDDPEIATRLKDHHRTYVSFIEDIVRRGIRSGHVNAGIDPRSFAFIFDGMGVMSNIMHLVSEDSYDAARVADMTDLLLASLKP